MSRKNLLTSLTEKKLTTVNSQAEGAPKEEKLTTVNSNPLPPAMERNRNRGAFGAITKSIDELAEKAQAAKEIEARLMEGSTVIELDPALIESSFVADRLGDDTEAFSELVEAIRERGQDTPILVRPHPAEAGRYMAVFGHRRLRVAKTLERPVRAVVKQLSDREHVIAQGQENSARADLSFIEKAVFASNLEAAGYDREVIMAALSVDKTVVSKMISVTGDIPAELIQAVGAAKNSGRDKWYRLALKLREADSLEQGRALTQSETFKMLDSDQRLELLTTQLETEKPKDSRDQTEQVSQWESEDKALRLTLRRSRKTATIALGNANGNQFAEWLSENVSELYSRFVQSKQQSGD